MILILLLVYQVLKRLSHDVLIDVEGKLFRSINKLFYFSLIIEILVMKRGDIFGGPGGEELWDDAEIATLTFKDTITSITASQSFDLAGLFRIKFIQNKYSMFR
jgi:hypothetical protein